jgi:hypothetical protein
VVIMARRRAELQQQLIDATHELTNDQIRVAIRLVRALNG